MMNVTRYEPWHALTQLNRELGRAFFRTPLNGDRPVAKAKIEDWVPAVDIQEAADNYVIHADIPGVDPKDIEITMEKGVLSIQGQRKDETKVSHENYQRVERVQGLFSRRFNLPEQVDTESISATGKNGVLEVIIPKLKAEPPRKINVQS